MAMDFSPGADSKTANGAGLTEEDCMRAAAEAIAEAKAAPPPQTLEDRMPVIAPAKDWAGKRAPALEWLVDGWIPHEEVTLLYGDGGVGKSLLMMQLITACAVGANWLGMPTRRCRALGFFCEDKEVVQHIRQDAINDHYECNHLDLVDMRTMDRTRRSDNGLVMFDPKTGVMDLTQTFYDLRETARDFKARLIVIDTAADVFSGNENDRGQVRKFLHDCLGRLAADVGCAVVLCAHPSRAGMTTGRGDGASTAWHNTARSRLYLRFPENGDKDTGADTRYLALPKANYGARQVAGLKLMMQDGVLRLPESEDNLQAIPREVGAERVFLELLDQLDTKGVRLSHSKNAAKYAPRVMHKIAPLGITGEELGSAMDRLLFQRGEIVLGGRGGNTIERASAGGASGIIEGML